VPAASPPQHFRPRHRLTHAREFQAVFGARIRKSRGPLTVFAVPNGLLHPRLGLSVGVRVGGAVVRNAVKRRLREAFRLNQARIPPGLDYVVTVQPHEPRKTAAYEEALVACCEGVAREWAKKTQAWGPRDV
jgi:ribonuclease P protein component